MSPELFNTIFWVFFGGVSLFILWGFVRMFLLRDESPPPPAARGATRKGKAHSAGGGSHADNAVAGLGVIGSSGSTSIEMSSDTGGDTASDSGGESGGGDFSGGGGDSGGGGSSGGW